MLIFIYEAVNEVYISGKSTCNHRFCSQTVLFFSKVLDRTMDNPIEFFQVLKWINTRKIVKTPDLNGARVFTMQNFLLLFVSNGRNIFLNFNQMSLFIIRISLG